MRYFTPDSTDPVGTAPTDRPHHGGDSSLVPSDMDNDPRADEEIIDQRTDGSTPPEQYPKPVDAPKITPDNLADSIAYALDGSGPGPTKDVSNISGHKVIMEGITGAGPEDEEDALRS